MAVGGGGATAFSFFFSFLFPSFSAHSCALPRIPSYEEMWKKRETNVWAAGVNVHLKKRGEREEGERRERRRGREEREERGLRPRKQQTASSQKENQIMRLSEGCVLILRPFPER